MASILNTDINLSDSDSDDFDYIPEKEVSDSSGGEAEPEVEGENINERKKRGRKRKSSKVQSAEENTEGNKQITVLSAEEEKKRTEDVWNSFLNDVGRSAATKSDDKLTNPSNSTAKKIKVTEVFEFAGESVEVTKEIDGDAKENTGTKTSQSANSDSGGNSSKSVDGNPNPSVMKKRQGGLNSLVGSILNKKQKMTTLQKSLYDWNTYKKEEGLEEELQKFNKGKGGYLERQAFLQRSDVRQFEIEKNIRLSNKKK